jgi:hypothetical protein
MKNYTLTAFGAVLCLFLSVQAMAQTGLKTGATAPAFTATDNAGKTVDLKALVETT